MAWWRKKVVFPVRRAWAAVSTRVRARKTGQKPNPVLLKHGYRNPRGSGGILKLHEDVQTCGYKDVQVMFEMLRSELEVSSHALKPRKRTAWRPSSAWSGRSSIAAQ